MTCFKTIVTGHGHFATGIKEAVKLLAGSQKALTFIDFTESMSEQDLNNQLKQATSNQPTLIFTDLTGGTPYKEAAKIAFSNNNVVVVAGCNLTALLETLFTQYTSLLDYANDLVKITKQSAQILDFTEDTTQISTNQPEDGI